MEPEYRYRAEVLDVHDGDTYKLRVDLGFRCAVTIQCRLHGVDTPELPSLEGRLARDFVRFLLYDESVVIESYRDQRSFERWVCDVWAHGGSLADLIVEAGHGKRI